jgi:flagellar biogenesis protein FliO
LLSRWFLAAAGAAPSSSIGAQSAQSGASGPFEVDLVRIFLALLFVLGLGIAAIFAIRRLQSTSPARFGSSERASLTALARIPGKVTVYAVDYRDRTIVFAVAPAAVARLADFERVERPVAEENPS